MRMIHTGEKNLAFVCKIHVKKLLADHYYYKEGSECCDRWVCESEHHREQAAQKENQVLGIAGKDIKTTVQNTMITPQIHKLSTPFML